MKLELQRDCLQIIPETVPDEIYIEYILGLTQHGESVPLTRVGFQSNGHVLLRLEARKD